MVGIYKITSPTGKVYIGQSTNIANRWNDYHKLRAKGQVKLYNSLLKHGPKKHTYEVLLECDQSSLNKEERYYQEYYNTLQDGLNCRLTKTEDKSGKTLPFTDDHKAKLRCARANVVFTDVRRKRMSDSMLGKNTTAILCINTGEVFSSIKEAAMKYNLVTSSIDNILSGRAKQTQKQKLKFTYY
jgi:group I intron endonuclease